jgi:hypothetical protein
MVAGVVEPARRIFLRDGRRRSPYRFDQRFAHACALLAHEGFELAEGFFYGVLMSGE